MTYFRTAEHIGYHNGPCCDSTVRRIQLHRGSPVQSCQLGSRTDYGTLFGRSYEEL